MPDDLKKRSIRGFAWAAGEGIGTAGISLVSFIILARLLDPQDFGIFALATVFIFFCNLIIAHGLADALVQRQVVEPAHLDTAFWSTLILSLVLMAGCWAIAIPATGWFNEPRLADVLWWLALTLPVGAASTVQMALFRRDMRFDSVTRRSLVGRVAGAVVAVAMAYLGYGLWALVAQQVVGQLVITGAFLSANWRPRWRYSTACFRDLWGFGFHVSASQIISGAGEQALTVVIGAMFGTTALGYFTVAWRAIQLLKSLISGAVYHVGLSAFSKLQADRTALTDAFLNATRISCLIGFPIAIGTYLVADPLIHLAFDIKWVASIPLFAMLSLELMPSFFGMFLTALYRATDRPAWVLWMACVYTATGFLCVIAATPFGIAVAVAAWVARSFLLMPIHTYLVGRVLAVPALRVASPATTPLIACAGMAAGVLLLRLELPADLAPIPHLAIVVPVAVALYGAVVWLLNPPLARMALRTVAVLLPGGKNVAASTPEGSTPMKELKMKRRGVLLSLAALLVPGTISGMWWMAGGAPKTLAEALFSDIRTARAIGVKYLAQAPHECDASILAANLPNGCAVPPASPLEIDSIRKIVDAQRQSDFATGDTVLIDGWILARTEARLCALAALSA